MSVVPAARSRSASAGSRFRVASASTEVVGSAAGQRSPFRSAWVRAALLRTRLQAEFVEEHRADLGVAPQRLLRPSQAALGQHPQRPEPLAQRRVGQARAQREQRALRGAGTEEGLGLQLAQLVADLRQPGHRCHGPGFVGEPGVGPAPPQAQRPAAQRPASAARPAASSSRVSSGAAVKRTESMLTASVTSR